MWVISHGNVFRIVGMVKVYFKIHTKLHIALIEQNKIDLNPSSLPLCIDSVPGPVLRTNKKQTDQNRQALQLAGRGRQTRNKRAD